MQLKIGTAGWAIPREVADRFPASGSSLERYSREFDVVEINSSFHRTHRLSTWARWGDSVPDGFAFSVKMPKAITHVSKLRGCGRAIEDFLAEAKLLGNALAVILVQLPPKLEFEAGVARDAFLAVKELSTAKLACEPRNASWFTPEATALLIELGIARVAADPAPFAAAAFPGGWPGLRYWRLHGSPQLYRSSYADQIELLASRLIEFGHDAQESWCIFDNTASSAALGDALLLRDAIRAASEAP